jgi:hypothetical protein
MGREIDSHFFLKKRKDRLPFLFLKRRSKVLAKWNDFLKLYFFVSLQAWYHSQELCRRPAAAA